MPPRSITHVSTQDCVRGEPAWHPSCLRHTTGSLVRDGESHMRNAPKQKLGSVSPHLHTSSHDAGKRSAVFTDPQIAVIEATKNHQMQQDTSTRPFVFRNIADWEEPIGAMFFQIFA